MSAIFKREFKTFFTSPIGYFVLAVLFGFSGFYFFASNMYAGSADLSGRVRRPVHHRAAAGAAGC